MFGALLSKKVVVTTAVISMFRCAPGTDILIAAESQQRRVDASGVTRAMYNVGYTKAGAADQQLANAFLRDNSAAFHIGDVNTELRATEATTSERGSHIRYTQTYQGIPVHRGEIIVSTTSNNEVGMVINNYKKNISLTLPTRHIGATSAIAAVRATLPSTIRIISKKNDAVLMVWQDERSEYHITYRVRLTTENPLGDWEAFVDAKNGSVLHIENRFANAEHVQGSGYVHLTDPLSAAKKRYGAAGFTDNNDGDSDSLNFYRTHVTLDSLTFENGVYKLKGPYCKVEDIESPADAEYFATTPDGFNFTRSQQEFEAVSVYYHVSRSYQYIQSLGFSNASLAEVRLDPHGLGGVDNSHYSPGANYIAWGEGGIDDAEDVDAILHEYAHAIVFNFIPTWGGGESGALGEGYSDYWAASYSRATKGWTPTCYEYNWVYNWNAHNMFQLGRTLNDSRTYPFTGSDVHDNGQIWSSTLMAIWNELGKETTDKLVLKSLQYLGSCATGVDAAQALIQADRDLYNGAHLSTLIHWLGTVKRFIQPTNYLPTIAHTRLNDMQLTNWNPLVRATVSQNRDVEAVWVEFTINNGISRMLPLAFNGNGVYDGEFCINPRMLNVGDSISYKIFARYVGEQLAATNPINGSYTFRILGAPTSVGEEPAPTAFQLMQNYPNPFNPTTNISYAIAEQSVVALRVYNMLGQLVATLSSDVKNAGRYTATWNSTNESGAQVASGMYVYRLEATNIATGETAIQQKRLTLIK